MLSQSFLALASLLLPLTTLHVVVASPVNQERNVEERGVNVGWPYGNQKIRGVNLGGWLVLEPWITPSLFDNTNNPSIVDEWTFSQNQDRGVATAALTNHWNTWITQADMQAIAGAGLNHVRIPIGFWAYDVSGGEPYIQGQAQYLDQAIGWARGAGLKVIIDLHGAPGSQNGYDNSGKRGYAGWADDPNNVLRTKNVVEQLSKKYSDPSYWQVVTMLGLLNEPATYLNPKLLSTARQYWYDAYGAARYPWAPQGSSSKSGLALIISDGFQNLNTFNNYMPEPTWETVFLDTHNYQVFDNYYQSWDYPTHLSNVCQKAGYYSGSPLWLMVGEWSLASTDCAKSINGRGLGSRYDGSYPGSSYVGNCATKTGDGSNFSAEYKTFLRQYYDVQTQVYENSSQGWTFWAWKAEGAAEWSYSAGLQGGWIPYDPTQHLTSAQSVCGSS